VNLGRGNRSQRLPTPRKRKRRNSKLRFKQDKERLEADFKPKYDSLVSETQKTEGGLHSSIKKLEEANAELNGKVLKFEFQALNNSRAASFALRLHGTQWVTCTQHNLPS
jgi:hypothetical protein